MKKAFSITVKIICLLFSVISIGAVILNYSENREAHSDLFGKNASSLLPETGKEYFVKSFKDIEECKSVNQERFNGALMEYSEFRLSCDEIWSQALMNDAKGNEIHLLGGFSVITVFGIERYYPIIQSWQGELTYPGGFPARYEYTVLSNDEAKVLNYGLKGYGIE